MTDTELTKELACRVMGWTVEREAAGYLVFASPHEKHTGWSPLSDIAHAWMLVDVMCRGWIMDMENDEHGCCVSYSRNFASTPESHTALADTAPRAICMATLAPAKVAP
jgi:hypothetical protein